MLTERHHTVGLRGELYSLHSTAPDRYTELHVLNQCPVFIPSNFNTFGKLIYNMVNP